MSRLQRVKPRSLPRLPAGLPAALLLAVFAAACNKGSGASPPPLLNNPGDVDMVCFDRQYDPKRADADAGVVLPRHCCSSSFVDYGTGAAADDEACTASRVDPVPHALVTQTLRGEVAAIDLIADEVLDSLRSIPGYTFVDVGGEPTAVVVPPAFPCSADASLDEQERGCGAPEFTFVSGREQDQVRAIPTCRFRMGRDCGPDLLAEPTAAQKVVQLVGAPHDMVLDPNKRALWITLPERGLLARVALGTRESRDDGSMMPFELDKDGVPKAPEYFPLSSGVDLTPPEPVLETDPYLFTCGLGYSFDPALDRLRLPSAPRVVSQKRAHPTRMELVDVGDGEPTLLVVDDAQAVVHALGVSDAGPSLRGLMPVGAPLRDFAVTPGVPAQAPTAEELVSKSFYYTPDVTDSTKEYSKRYLYGIDARDGSVMVFELLLSAGVPELKPLQAPAPARDTVRRFANFSDRIGVGGDGAFSARTLTVLDTRAKLLPTGERDDFYCGEFDQAQIELEKNNAAARSPERYFWEHQEEVLNAATDKEAHEALRGVFVMITGASGAVAVIDVHNLDLQCRARANCDPDDPIALTNSSAARGVALQRHAVRLSGIEAATANVSSSEDLEKDRFRFGDVSEDPGVDGGTEDDPEADGGEPGEEGEDPVEPDAGVDPNDGGLEPGADDGGAGADDAGGDPEEDAGFALKDGCPIGYYRVNERSAIICAAANPWRARPTTWTVTYRGALSVGTLFTAALEEGKDGEIFMQAPEGLDFCERGVQQDGLAAVILSKPEDGAPDYCERDADEPFRLLIRQAYQDHLVLEMDPEVKLPSGDAATFEDLRVCFSDFSEFQVRFADRWRVQTSESFYTHRVMTGPDGACVIDPQIDRRWDAQADWLFPYVDSFIAFQLRKPNPVDPTGKEALNPTITLDLEAAPLTMPFTSGPRFDTLPVRMRWFPETGYLFVVDAASQGLTSISTFPLLEVDESYH